MLHPDFASTNSDNLPKAYILGDLPEVLSEFSAPFALSLLHCICGTSPYLSKLAQDYPDQLRNFFAKGADATFSILETEFSTDDEAKLMSQLRHYKHRAALIIALADISGLWNLQQVTAALSKVAQRTLQASLNYLINFYKERYSLEIKEPEEGCGIIVLAMGKLGARELNYSSDVDLIMLYEANKLSLNNGKPLQRALNRLAQDFVRIMQDRTADSYVFRMDLRLRPDPASTPLILNTETAFRYYESVGQNWERAAFIKARAIAGDIKAGEQFLAELKPFIWRKSLDFAAIADIQSIKRQMDREFNNLDIEIAGYDVKKGIGGIREIEFLAQIHQLIWGGRTPELRNRSTLETYNAIENMGLLTADEVATMKQNYETLRMVEHRLQMLRDEQTHMIPKEEAERDRLAAFCGYSSRAELEKTITRIAIDTHSIYRNSFNERASLAGEGKLSLAGEGKLSFTGVSHDADTLATIRKMGFKNAETVCNTIQAWHRGNVPAMRSSRARELLTELTPSLLKHLAKQQDADASFKKFSRFFSNLPAGVMLLSLLYNNPQILQILTTIIGNAPLLAEYLSQHPDWLDMLLSTSTSKTTDIENITSPDNYRKISNQPDEAADWLCRYRCENEFLMGCQILNGALNPLDAMPPLTHIADIAINELSLNVIKSFEEQYGRIKGGSFNIIALGRLGSKELTFGSDLDLLFIYDSPDEAYESDGKRQLGVAAYYNRLAQRIAGQLTAMTPEGRLYEVDSRLRPAGSDGPIAASLSALRRYYDDGSAWVFERMALIRHRTVFSYPDSASKKLIENSIQKILCKPIDKQTLQTDALDMRKRIVKEFTSSNIWEVKHAKGGLTDISFIAQIMALQNVEIIAPSVMETLTLAVDGDIINKNDAEILAKSLSFQQHLQTILRLCHQNHQASSFSSGLKEIIAKSLALDSFTDVEQALIKHQQASYDIFSQIIGEYV